MHVLIAGCGWLGTAVARALLARGDRVTGVRSDAARAEALRPLGIEPLCLELSDPAAGATLPRDLEAIVACQSAGGEGEAPYRRAYLEANRTLLSAARTRPVRAFVYTGSTGLFGQRDGSDVDESTPPAPATASGRILAEAEARLLEAAAQGQPVRIVRLSGLYGPGRTWMIDRVRSGLFAQGAGDEAWMNACHQDDAAAAVLAALDRGRTGGVYHGTDAEPMRRREVVAFVAGRLGIPPPQAARSAPADGPNRRILGERTRAELGFALRWPSLREGLGAFLPPG